nr:hypothetical protein [Tanacetum cinerariifolium]
LGGLAPIEPRSLDAEPVDPVLEANSLPKFDMRLYKYSRTETHVMWLVKCYGIPADLHSRVVSEDMTMDALPNDAIRLYAHHFQLGGLRDAPIAMAWQHHDSSNADLFPKYNEYDALGVARLRKVVLALRKPPPSLLYIAGLSHVWKHVGRTFSLKDPKGKVMALSLVTMAEFLRLPNFQGCKVAVGVLLPSGSAWVTYLANPVERLEDLPPKTGDMVEKVAEKRGVGKEGTSRKKRRVHLETLVHPNSEHVSSPIPLNHAHPLEALGNKEHVSTDASVGRMDVLRNQIDEHVTPLSVANVDGPVGDQRLESVEKHALEELVPDVEASYSTGRFALTEEHANLFYAHESCKDMKVHYKEWLEDRVEELKKEKAETEGLRVDMEKFVIECRNWEMVRRNIINEYLPTFERRLHQSAEYKRSLGDAFSLAIRKGFVDVISIGRKDPNNQAILAATPNVDPASSNIFMETYEKLFDKRYPYVNNVAHTYILDPTDLQNVMPDATGPTPSGGPRDAPTTSYA